MHRARRGTLMELLSRAPGAKELRTMCGNARKVAEVCDILGLDPDGSGEELLTDRELRSLDDGWFYDGHMERHIGERVHQRVHELLGVDPPEPPDGSFILPDGA